jgi:hypothetical protein
MEPAAIEFKPIQGHKMGQVALTIYPPGGFFDSTHYTVFVGGSGVSRAKTLKEAKALLLQFAKAKCVSRVREAAEEQAHYARQLKALQTNGLTAKRRPA